MKQLKFLKIFNKWEYWPSYMFYLPNIPYATYLALKARHLVFYTATNPALKHAGNGSESKYELLQLIPERHRPFTILIRKKEQATIAIEKVNNANITYPLIAKPDIGFRGLLVKIIRNELELRNYLNRNNAIDLLIQEYLDFEHECGIFYIKFPKDNTSQITSLTLKKFLTVIGDGTSTIESLILNDQRAKRYLELLKTNFDYNFNNVLGKGEKKVLTMIGNHSKGTEFINGNHLINEELTRVMDRLFEQIPNWYYGRLDIKYKSFESLLKGEDFKIIELNGILSEPTHIYDASKGSYFKSLRQIRKHWRLACEISIQNHREFGVKYGNAIDFLKSIQDIKKHTKLIKKIHNS